MKRVTTGQPRPVRGFRTGPAPDPNGSRAQRRLAAKRGTPHLRDAATLCLAVFPAPGEPLVCKLPAGHLDAGQKHKDGCTSWGHPTQP
ncbi:hypothetical protein [Micromonospora sp. DT229]|uniref:hypothetical protein n=1 Tax=Micromonospora sp. DT229 TaxID=3393430 RepID=UPI003CEC730E